MRRFKQPEKSEIKTELKIAVGVATVIGACIFGSITLQQAQSKSAKAYNLAIDHSIAGKDHLGYCMDYAIALSNRLAAEGIHGRLIFYRWHIKGSSPTDETKQGAHVFVEYEADGQKWIVDNENDFPIRVQGDDYSPRHLIFLLGGAPLNVDVELCDSLNKLSFF